jgi:exopolyphosphatase/pppGpp-phosphohydrolase
MPQQFVAEFCTRVPQLHVLSKEAEACCSLVAAVNGFAGSQSGEETLVIDQGTGSMEMARGRVSATQVNLVNFMSYKLGTQSLVEQFIKLGSNVTKLDKALDATLERYRPIGEDCVSLPVVLGSAATKLAWFQAKTTQSIKSEKYDSALAHGQVIDLSKLNFFLRLAESQPEIVKGLLDPQQGGTQAFEMLVTGLVALSVLLRKIKQTKFKVSSLGTRHGVAWMLSIYAGTSIAAKLSNFRENR